MATACLILSAVLLLLSTHPFCSYPVSLLVARRFRNFTLAKTSIVSSENLSYAICVCAYNEEKVIVNKVLNLLELRSVFPGIQILVYVDAASDRTPELLEEYSDQINLVVSRERHGKTYGMNLLASMTQADIVMFSDANVMIDIESTRNLHQYFKNPEIGCVSANLRYQNAEDSVTSQAGATYWKFEEWIKTLETACGGSMAADGALFAMRKSVYESPPAHIIDDFYLSLKVIIKGLQVVQAGNVIAYERSAVNSGEEFVRKVRIGCQAFNIHRLLWPELKMLSSFTLYKYISHKLIRWLSGFLFIASCTFFELALILSEQYSFAITYVFMWLSMYVLGNVMGISPFSKIWELFSSLVATGVGVCKSLRGEVFQTWTPPTSARSKSSCLPQRAGIDTNL